MGRCDGEGREDKIDELMGNEYEVLEGAFSEGGNIIVELAHSCLMCVVLRIVDRYCSSMHLLFPKAVNCTL